MACGRRPAMTHRRRPPAGHHAAAAKSWCSDSASVQSGQRMLSLRGRPHSQQQQQQQQRWRWQCRCTLCHWPTAVSTARPTPPCRCQDTRAARPLTTSTAAHWCRTARAHTHNLPNPAWTWQPRPPRTHRITHTHLATVAAAPPTPLHGYALPCIRVAAGGDGQRTPRSRSPLPPLRSATTPSTGTMPPPRDPALPHDVGPQPPSAAGYCPHLGHT